jgi:arylformamidase
MMCRWTCLAWLLLSVGWEGSLAQTVHRNVPYVEAGDPRQQLDIYSPEGSGKRPVVFWIHGGGWQAGDRGSVQHKPQAFVEQGMVFVSTGYRLLPQVDMGTLIGDVAKAVGWVHQHIDQYGGDPHRIFIMGHSAGAQLAAILCTDGRYLQREGVGLTSVRGCVPVDGDTFDIPAIITTAEIRRQVHGQPLPSFGHREKFGNSPEKHREFSAVNHIVQGKAIPPFFILYVSGHPDTSVQAQRLNDVLKSAGIPVTLFGVKDTTHSQINADLGLAANPATQALLQFLDRALEE